MRSVHLLCAFTAGWLALSATTVVHAASCPNPDAIGTSRVLVVNPIQHPRVGTMQYHETLPLKDHEVVLTFDDGPLPPNTERILDILASQCVKATYFLVGQMAHTYPKLVQRIYAEGHTIGTHSQHHPFTFAHMTREQADKEVSEGIASVEAALGPGKAIAPFFRIPGLLRSKTVDDYLASRGLMTWSADFPADDWKHIGASEIVKRALTRIEAHGKGILLLHDIHPTTARALPVLLHQLKLGGYHIVQVMPATPNRPATPTSPDDWFMHRPAAPPVPMLLDVSAAGPIPGLPITDHYGRRDHLFGRPLMIPLSTHEPALRRRHRRHRTRDTRADALWPTVTKPIEGKIALPIPGPPVFEAPVLDEPPIHRWHAEAAPARANFARLLPQRAVPLPTARPELPVPLLPAQAQAPVAAPEQKLGSRFGANVLPRLLAHLWHRL